MKMKINNKAVRRLTEALKTQKSILKQFNEILAENGLSGNEEGFIVTYDLNPFAGLIKISILPKILAEQKISKGDFS